MTGIPLRIIESAPDGDAEPGMMWRYPEGDKPGRECRWIVLPNTEPRAPGYASEITWRTTDIASLPPHGMREVVGTPPLITVSPSINVECRVMHDGQAVREGSYWHGYIRNGMLEPA